MIMMEDKNYGIRFHFSSLEKCSVSLDLIHDLAVKRTKEKSDFPKKWNSIGKMFKRNRETKQRKRKEEKSSGKCHLRMLLTKSCLMLRVYFHFVALDTPKYGSKE